MMQRLETTACKDTQKSIEKTAMHGVIPGGGMRALNPPPYSASPGPSWSNTSLSLGTSTPSSSGETLRKTRVFNLHQRLRELYLEECRNGQLASNLPGPLRNLKRSSRLLEKLVERENLNTLIVNLYPGNKGYSLSLRLQGKVPAALGSQAGRSQGAEPVIETMRWPYSDEELLRCIDREELPATLVDLLEAEHSELFYQGCIIAEIRDSRLTFPLCNFETHHVLLKPTTQSILNDVNILSAAHDLSPEERLSLESQIVQATAPPLCLDPNPKIGVLLNNIQAKKHRFSTAPLRRTARKFSQVTVNRKRKLDQFTAHNTLHLYDFIAKKRAKAGQAKQTKKSLEGVLPPPPPVPCDESLPLAAPPTDPDVFKYAKSYEKAKETTNCTATLVEEYILETERAQGTIYHIKLTILQRASNAEYLGELYVDRDYKEGERNGASCRFVLGTRAHANRYIQQFTEIFTEEGRKSVRITHIIPGQPGRVSFTQGMKERTGQLQAMQAAAAAAAAAKPQPVAANTQQVAPNIVGHLPTATINLPKPTTSLTSVSHLTSLLKSASVPPNVNVHQIQQQSLSQQQQSQTTPAAMTTLTNSAIQSILSGALSSGVIAAEASNSNLANGPVHATQPHVGTVGNQTANAATVHYQPTPAQITNPVPTPPKPSRPALSSNPQINALANSLMNSAQQYELQQQNQAQAQAQAQASAPAAAAQNPTILSLLNAGTPLAANQKLVARKASNLNTRLLDQNFNAVLSNNVNNSTLLVNNNQLRVTLSSFPNQLVNQATGNSGTQQAAGFTLVTTQGNLAIANPPTQTYSLSSLTQQQGQTFTLTPSTGAQQGFTLSPAHNSQTFTVLQPNQNFIPSVQSQTFQINPGTTGQTFTITTPVVTVSSQFSNQSANSFTVNPAGQVFTVNIPSASNSTNNRAVTGQNLVNKTFTIQANSHSVAKADGTRVATQRVATQRRLSNAFQQVTHASELNKLLSDRSDTRVLTERHIADKSEQGNARLSQVLAESKTSSESKLSQALTGGDGGGTSNLGLSMPGLSALLAGTPSADNPIPGSSNSSSLLERLSTPSSATFTSPPPAPSPSQNITFQNSTFGTSPSHAFNSVNSNSPLPSLTSPGFASPSPKSQVQYQGTSPSSKESLGITSPLSSPPGTTPVINLQNLQNSLNLGLTSLPNLQVSIPGIVPISLSLNVPGQPGSSVLMTSLPMAATTNTTTTTSPPAMVLSNSSAVAGSVLSLPVAQLMSSSGKGTNARSPSASISIPQGSAQSLQLVSALQRSGSRPGSNQIQAAKAVQSLAARTIGSDQRPTIKMATGTGTPTQLQINTQSGQMVALSPQQFLQLQKHGFQSLNLAPQKNPVSPSAIANKHRRRSNAADPNK